LSLKGLYLVIVKPDIHVSTAEAYAGVKPQVPHQILTEVLSQPVKEWKHLLINDFEKSVFTTHPAIEAIKNELYDQGAIYASMSGSGSAVFGIFLTQTERSPRFNGMHYWADYLN
jgi:4-diphosphocytidyl-2-C-methyl-D-erythritol kinase